MDMIVNFLTPLTPWHWLAFGLVLIGIEMLVGTFDLLWIGTAALLTSLIGVLPLPAMLQGWEAQVFIFCALAVVLVILGRTAFAGLRKPPTSHPGLNRRADSMVGQRGTVLEGFVAGRGRVSLGDTSWLAVSETGEDLAAGEVVIVLPGGVSTTLKVSRA